MRGDRVIKTNLNMLYRGQPKVWAVPFILDLPIIVEKSYYSHIGQSRCYKVNRIAERNLEVNETTTKNG